MNRYSLFSVYGLELEYMIVDKKTLDVLPIVDKLFYELTGEYADEFENGDIAWNNELVLHVLEFKTNDPVTSLILLDKKFHYNILKANELLEKHNGVLMPTGAHPWMNPTESMRLWPHGNRDIYETFHRIFDCRGHGWANLQSMHINLPFKDSDEFVLLNNAIRLFMPLMPALTASTPILDNELTGYMSSRLLYYGKNQQKIPQISGEIIPESVNSIREYYENILNPMYEAIHSEDPKKVLQNEWLNARGAIARFQRNAIEIRIIDTQECPLADIACVYGIVTALKKIIAGNKNHGSKLSTTQLKKIYDDIIQFGFQTKIKDMDYLACFSIKEPVTAKACWLHVLESEWHLIPDPYRSILKKILEYGSLSERITQAVNARGKSKVPDIYRELIACLAQNTLFAF